MRLTPAAFVLAACAFGCSAGSKTSGSTSSIPKLVRDDAPSYVDAGAWEKLAQADVVIFAPRAARSALDPLVKQRESQGHVVASIAIEDVRKAADEDVEPDDPAPFSAAIERLAAHSKRGLAFVFLVGDVDTSNAAFPALPTYRHAKLDYESAGAKLTGDSFPTDHPYGVLEASKKRLAVGRLPARSTDDVRAFVAKVLAYENDPAPSKWRRRVDVTAGPAGFGGFIDGVIESTATDVLDHDLPYDFDVTFTFAKAGSPWAYPFDRLHQHFVDVLDEGAILAAYVGHGAFDSFDDARFQKEWYSIGDAIDAKHLSIDHGAPIFFSIACDTGAFDRPPSHPSLAEAMVMNPRGVIAAIASSRESHPYTNALYGKAVIEAFLDARATTIGEGLVDAETRMKSGSIPLASMLVETDEGALKDEHAELYNLLGDPATKIRWPKAAKVAVDRATYAAGDAIAVDVSVEGLKDATATITLETPRSVLRAPTTDGAKLEAMPAKDAFDRMEKEWPTANDKTVDSAVVVLTDGKAHVVLHAPKTAGKYVVKALATDDRDAAAGHADVAVK